ncbi:putative LRR receptor-like serine/threonine-protein kinase [Capsicum baccatum]|uniref:non-specific serine/threonine protein kinase n=1 Tax=Capsicum baccatum TaxID=33114 RepID=A0A2G2VZE6_CAPBA|nr:putative LRR receptor-like serine/threonine-protein kinase [Capsicum baccatum]
MGDGTCDEEEGCTTGFWVKGPVDLFRRWRVPLLIVGKRVHTWTAVAELGNWIELNNSDGIADSIVIGHRNLRGHLCEPLPQEAYSNALGDFPNKLLRKCYRINCGYNWSLRYPIDQYDRIWDADEDFSPFHVSSGFDIQANFNMDLHNNSLAGETQNISSLQHLKMLNLSFNQLAAFGSELEDLINLQFLLVSLLAFRWDLHNNSFQGTVPDSIGELTDLHLLNLENNKLQGPLPQSLNREICLSFTMSLCNEFSRNPTIETPQVTVFAPTKRKRHNRLAVILAAVGGAVFALFGTAAEMKNWNAAKVFSYKEIKAATNNFKEVIGRGSFGSVYLGKLPDSRQVAVKVRFDKTQLGADSFMNEVSLLSCISHPSLVVLEGFCHESKQQILVYEYLPGGSLTDNLYGAMRKKLTLSWVCRLKIAVDAAKGLDYLHNGSEPKIIHRDVKSSNILLDADMNAKVSDFGLSKRVTQSDATHVSTVVKGTAGYLDPEYYSTQQLTEKSDIYSFGVVLLELICGRGSRSHSGSPDSFNLILKIKGFDSCVGVALKVFHVTL